MSPTVEYVMDKWKLDGSEQYVIIEGRVTAMTVSWEMKRNVAGAYTSDTVRGYARMEPKLSCTFVVNKPAALVKGAGDDLPIVGEVFRRFGSELGRQTYDLLVKHNETVFTLRDGKPKPQPRIRGLSEKEVQKKKEVAL